MKKYTGIYRAKVLATDELEDDKLGRIKIEIYPMLIGVDTAANLINIKGIATELLPWATPAMSLFSGAGPGFGSFAIPEVGSFVFAFFENGDIYQPVYFAEAQTKVDGLPIERLIGYPYKKVWKSAGGVVVEINDTDGSQEIKVTHPAGTIFQIDSSGNLIITVAGTTTITSTGNLSVAAPRIDLN